jgi:hypothetical protein
MLQIDIQKVLWSILEKGTDIVIVLIIQPHSFLRINGSIFWILQSFGGNVFPDPAFPYILCVRKIFSSGYVSPSEQPGVEGYQRLKPNFR